MKSKPHKYIFIIFLQAYSLCNISGQNMVKKPLTLKEVFSIVKNYHPLSYQAKLQPEMAKAELLKAKGSFDPEISSIINQKYFNEKEYYSLISGELKIPTGIGADIKTGYELNRGIFLDPENSTPSNGLIYTGVGLPIGQGLLIDERRASLWKARILQDFAYAKKSNMTNELLFSTAVIYWEWFRAYNVKQILQASLDNAKQRYEAVKFNVDTGDRPAVDTVEAKIQIQNINLGLNQANLEYSNISTLFSGYFWNKENTNIGLSNEDTPNEINTEMVLVSNEVSGIPTSPINDTHPYLEQLRQSINQLKIDKKLKKEKLKPKIDIQYNPLFEATRDNFINNFAINNFKWGLEFKMPLFLRKERGDVKITELKIRETDLILQNKSTELNNKYNTYISEWKATQEQIQIYDATVNLYEQMFNAEKKLFDLGESSLFLINAREQSFITAKIKLSELIAKNRIAFYSILYYNGKLETYED